MGHHRTKVAMRQENADVNNKSEEDDHHQMGREGKKRIQIWEGGNCLYQAVFRMRGTAFILTMFEQATV
jgi:hypothetical protein